MKKHRELWTLRKKVPTKKGSWCLNWVQQNPPEIQTNIQKNPEPSSHFYTGASQENRTSQRSLHWTACLCTKLSACTMFLPSQPDLIKEILQFYFNQLDWGFPHPIGVVQLIPLVSSPTNQSSSILTNQQSVFCTNQTARIGSSYLYEDRTIRVGFLSI